jgi:hypothetical protein
LPARKQSQYQSTTQTIGEAQAISLGIRAIASARIL